MSNRRIDLSKFRGASDDEDEDGPPGAKPALVLDPLKAQVFSRGIQKKSKKDLEREAEERKRVEEEKAAAIAFREFQEAFEGDGASSAPLGGTRDARGPPRGPRGGWGGARGFVRAGEAEAYQPGMRAGVGPGPGPGMNALASGSGGAYGRGQGQGQGYQSGLSAPGPRIPSPEPSKPKPKGKRAMDDFLEQIKRDQREREEKFGKAAALEGSSVSAMAAWEKERGSRDTGDPETTNLYISNLPTHITESSLGMFFAKYGPVGTVKVMWPRGDEDASIGAQMTNTRRTKAGLSGFVAYMKRKDAEVAVKELDGLDWGGSVLRVGWSKAVRVPLRPIYEIKTEEKRRSRSPPRHRRGRSRSRSPPSRDRSYSRSRSPVRRRRRSLSRSRSRSRSRSPRNRAAQRSRSRSYSYSSRSRSRSRSSTPRRKPRPKSRNEVALEKLVKRIDPEKEKFVRAVAAKVEQHGSGFEEMLRERERRNEKFAFLRDVELPEYHLYRHCADPRYRLPTPPPDDFGDDGRASIYSSDSAEESERERTRKGQLGKFARKRFESMLRGMSGTREEIARCMEFALVHADAADEVAEIICQSLKIESTPVPRKIARLHLVSDILHNSASPMPNVWKYRQAFETRLPAVFSHLSDLHRSLIAYSGRLGAESFRAQCGFVVTIWENWIVFTPAVTDLMKAILNGADLDGKNEPSAEGQPPGDSEADKGLPSSKFKKSGGFKASFKPLEAVQHSSATVGLDDVDGEVMAGDLDGQALDDGDLDGDALADDLDGEALDGEALDNDVDGAPIPPSSGPTDRNGEGVDGEDMAIDVDGEAV